MGLGRFDLTSHAGNRELRGGRLPLVLGAEPCDGFFVGWDVGSAGLDAARVNDRAEFHTRGVVENVFGRIWAGVCRVRTGNENVDLHAGLQKVADGDRRRGTWKKAVGEINGYEMVSDAG